MAAGQRPVSAGDSSQPSQQYPVALPPPPFTAPGHLRIWRTGLQEDARWSVWCLLGNDRPKPVRGFGGWGTSQRAGRRAVSSFDGSDTLAMQLSVLVEDVVVPTPDTDSKLKVLERLAGLDVVDDTPPPPLKWIANVRHDYAHAPRWEWVVESFELGDDYAKSGRLVWAMVTMVVGLVRSTEVDVSPSPGFGRSTLRKGHDLRDFARGHLGDPKRWPEVAELNRDNPRCPRTGTAKAKRDVQLLVPPKG